MRSGEPVTVTQPCGSQWHCRPDVAPGTAANGILRNPATWTTDLALSKNFKVRERMNLQIRGDMFNFLNHVNYSGPNSDVSSASFGEINGAGGMRVIQLNARFSW